MLKFNFIKDVKFNGPATIVFWEDGTKTIVKCKDENYDTEKGLAMALAKGYTEKSAELLIKNIHIFNEGIEVVWANGTTTEMPWKDKTHDIEKHIALAKIKKYGALVRGVKNTNWYDQFKKFLPKEEPKQEEVNSDSYNPSTDFNYDEIVKNFHFKTKEHKLPIDAKKLTENFTKAINTSSLVNKINSDYVIEMFNAGASIKQISKETGISEYYVKKYIDAETSPEVSKNKAARILNKAAKASKKEKKPRGCRVKITFNTPSYLDEETGKRILEDTKVKYAGRYKYDSDLQKFYIRECKLEYIKTHYNNGYSMYDIAKVLGISASGVQRIWNEYKANSRDFNEEE